MPPDVRVRCLERARSCVGVPFRLHGRTPDYGLDCAGLVAFSLGIEGIPTGYAMRGMRDSDFAAKMRAAGLARTSQRPEPGDILVLSAGPAQHHLGIWTGAGLIHADARLRRVVDLPGPPPWPLQSVWHLP